MSRTVRTTGPRWPSVLEPADVKGWAFRAAACDCASRGSVAGARAILRAFQRSVEGGRYPGPEYVAFVAMAFHRILDGAPADVALGLVKHGRPLRTVAQEHRDQAIAWDVYLRSTGRNKVLLKEALAAVAASPLAEGLSRSHVRRCYESRLADMQQAERHVPNMRRLARRFVQQTERERQRTAESL